MTTETPATFIIDCPQCKAKVAAIEHGRAINQYFLEGPEEPCGIILAVGNCPKCHSLLAGESRQIGFKNYDADEDAWSDMIRVYPHPPKTFLSFRIPKAARDSIAEADKCLQANANTAACAMLGRALEAVCRNLLQAPSQSTPLIPPKPLMLFEGIKGLKDNGLIDDRLFEWSQQLHKFRNIAAHPTDEDISREDAEDLQSFVYAIIEYVYDLTDRYNEFKGRVAKKAKKSTPILP